MAYEESIIKDLRCGNFDGLNLNLWVNNKQFNYIEATIDGLDKVIDPKLFDIIVITMEFLFSEELEKEKQPNYEFTYAIDFWYLRILEKAILVASRHQEYKDYVNQLFYSENDRIRLLCYANLDLNKTIREQLKNKNNEIRRIVSIRDEFEHIWNTEIDEYTKERINWFEKMIEVGAIYIDLFPGGICNYEVQCFFFENDKGRFIVNDILRFIKDKRIIPYFLNRMYENGELRFKEGVRLPECFENKERKKHIKVRRKENTTKESKGPFDELYQVIK